MTATQLRIFWPDDQEQPSTPAAPVTWESLRWDGQMTIPADVSPPIGAGQTFASWWLARGRWLEAGEGVSESTMEWLFTSAAWAVRTAGDVALQGADRIWVSRVRQGLEKATYTRGRFNGKPRPLSMHRQDTIMRGVRRILRLAGCAGDDLIKVHVFKRTKGLMPSPKSCYTIPELQRLIVGAESFHDPALPRGFWRLTYGTLFYTGLRRTAALGLQWDHMQELDGELYFDCDGALNKKTGKPLWVKAHACLAPVLREFRAISPLAVIPWPYCLDRLLTAHKENLRRAGIPWRRGLDIHGIRRTLDNTGVMHALRAAIRTAAELSQHADVKTTLDYYVDLREPVAETIAALPALW